MSIAMKGVRQQSKASTRQGLPGMLSDVDKKSRVGCTQKKFKIEKK